MGALTTYLLYKALKKNASQRNDVDRNTCDLCGYDISDHSNEPLYLCPTDD